MRFCQKWILIAFSATLFLGPLTNVSFAIPINVTGSGAATINGSDLIITAFAVGDATTGIVQATLNYSAQPLKWDMAANFITIFSGINIGFSQEIDCGYGLGINLLTLTEGNYEVNRSVTFLDLSSMTTIGSLTMLETLTRDDPSNISANVIINASGDFSSQSLITSIIPFDETLTPSGPGEIIGNMTVPFVTETGNTIAGIMDTTYSFDPSLTLPFPQLRELDISFIRVNPLTIDATYETTVCAVPEPTTMLLLGSGLIGLAGFRRKFRN